MIKKWVLKAIVQKVISFLPGAGRINYFFQKRVTRGVELTDEHFGYKIQHARDHLEYLNSYGDVRPDNRVLELGTGWYPIVPLIFYLTDSGRVASVDIRNWMDKEKKLEAIRKLFEWNDQGRLAPYFTNLNRNKWEALKHMMQNPEGYSNEMINEVIGLKQIIGDAAHLELDTGSMDFICSNNTLEHIHKEPLRQILTEFKRVLKSGGTMSHFIDCSDHFAHFDSSITIYNFLKFSECQWKFIDNRIQPQNRMRFIDYRQMFSDLEIPVSEVSTRDGEVELLEGMRIHKMFASYSLHDLAISHGYIISKFP